MFSKHCKYNQKKVIRYIIDDLNFLLMVLIKQIEMNDFDNNIILREQNMNNHF